MSRTIGSILTLRDRMSPSLFRVSRNVNNMNQDMQRASRRAANMANKFTSSVNKMVAKSAKFAAIGAAAIGAVAVKTGLNEAFDLEGYRMQLNTATKDTEKAADIMRYAIGLANKTPFEGGELVEGAAKFEAMGMSAKKWLPMVGDMAAATNKSFDQAVEALIDAQSGELERLKEFGLTKAKIAEKGEKMFGKALVNGQGQITDMAKFNEAIMALMNERFAGGMEQQANTVKGMWSTVTGITKSSLAKILGMQEDGTIKAGSLLERVKSKVKSLADKLTEWQNDGTIERVGQKFTDTFEKIYGFLSRVYDFIKKYQDVIIFVGVFIVTLSALSKIVLVAMGAFRALAFATALFNGALSIGVVGAIILGIAALVAIGVLLWKNWDTVKAKAAELWTKITEVFGGIGSAISGAFTGAWEAITGFFDWIGEKLSWLGDKIKSIPYIGKLFGGGGPEEGSTSALSLGGKALGTPYWRGGLTYINERGGEIVDLPNGSRVIPADKSQKMMGSGGVTIGNITINAKGITPTEVVNEVVPQLKLALANM